MVYPCMVTRWFLLIGLATLLASTPGSSLAQAGLDQMRDLLDGGYYNSAAQLNGPDLVARHPDDPEAHFLYAKALYLTGNLTDAQTQVDLAIELSGDAVEPTYAHLDALLQAAGGDPQGALRALQTAYLRTHDYRFAMDWGRVAWQAGAYDEALEAFQAAESDATGADAMWPKLDRGRLLMFLDRPDEAITAFDGAIDVFEATDPGGARPGSPAYVEAFYRLGEAYEALGDIDKAETNYRSARTADPNYAPAIAALDRLSRQAD